MQRLTGPFVVAGCLSSGSALKVLASRLPHLSIIFNNDRISVFQDSVTVPPPCSHSTIAATPTSSCPAAFIGAQRPNPTFWRRLSTIPTEAAQPLLNIPPSTDAAPFPSAYTCPTLEALDVHVQRHGYKYSLRHVAAGLETLSSLAPAANAASDTTLPTGGDQARVPGQPSGPLLRPTVAAAPPLAAPGVSQCARRLALLGRHQMKVEVDVEAMAGCIRGFAGLSDLGPAARVQLALPFARRLRDPPYFFALRSQPAPALLALLQGLSRLPPLHRHVPGSNLGIVGQVVARLVVGLTPQVGSLSAADACRATAALVRLGCSTERREADVYSDFLKALAAHISQSLVEGGQLTPDQAVRLLWAYAVVAPGACGQTIPGTEPEGGAGTGAGGGAVRQHSAPAAAPLGNSAKAAAASAPGSGGGGEVVRRMVGSLSRVACRGLDSHPPLELVKLVYSLPRLGAGGEAEAVLPRVTPRLLRGLDSLDLHALADVASSYAAARISEPGLMQAVAERVLELEQRSPQIGSKRAMSQLLGCYGQGGSHEHPALREVLQRVMAGERMEGGHFDGDEGADLGSKPASTGAVSSALLRRPPGSSGPAPPSTGRRGRGRGAA